VAEWTERSGIPMKLTAVLALRKAYLTLPRPFPERCPLAILDIG
jgi:hypothetical protein